MAGVVLTVPPTRWACPSCTQEDTTTVAGPHTRMHPCAGFHGATIPMVPLREVRTVRHTAHEREDYIGPDTALVQMYGGRPVMNVITEHGDGRTDCTVFAPTASVTVEGLSRG